MWLSSPVTGAGMVATVLAVAGSFRWITPEPMTHTPPYPVARWVTPGSKWVRPAITSWGAGRGCGWLTTGPEIVCHRYSVAVAAAAIIATHAAAIALRRQVCR